MIRIFRDMFGGFVQTHDLEASLRSPDRKGPRAEAAFEGWANGHYRLRIDLEDSGYVFAGHATLDVIIEGHVVGEIPVRAGKRRTRFSRTHRDGPLGFVPQVGQHVGLGQNGLMMVSGTFHRDD